MDFSPYDGFCCPLVDKLPSTADYEPRISNFMTWVKSLPAKPPRYGRPPSASTAASLNEQAFVIKIVEEGYAYVFHGAFAPREGDGETGGFDRIPYFTLITSEFEEMPVEGVASEVVFCEKHEKRFLLNIYLKAPRLTDSFLQELNATTGALEVLEESCDTQMTNNSTSPSVVVPVVTKEEVIHDSTRIEESSKIQATQLAHGKSHAQSSDCETWTWV